MMGFALLFTLELNGENRKIAVSCDSVYAIESEYAQVRYQGLPKGVYSVGIYQGKVYPVYRFKKLIITKGSLKSWYLFSLPRLDNSLESICIESQIYPELINVNAANGKKVECMSLDDFFKILSMGNKCTESPKAA